MSDYSLIQELKREGSLVLYCDFRARSLLDLSGSGNALENLSDVPEWTYDGLQFCSGPGDSFARRLRILTPQTGLAGVGSSFTVIVHFPSIGPSTLTGHQSPLGTLDQRFETFIDQDPPTRVGAYYDGVLQTSNVDLTNDGPTIIGYNIVSGSKPDYYTQGVYRATGANNATVTPSNSPWGIGNKVTAGRPVHKLASIMVINRVLTATEHAQIYGELVS